MFRTSMQKEYGVYIISYGFSFLLAKLGHAYSAGFVLMVAAVVLYFISYRETKNLVDLKGLFSLSWIGGQALACLQFSRLQKDWSSLTWLCFFLAYFVFCISYNWKAEKQIEAKEIEKNGVIAKRVYICILVLAIASVLCFLTEVIVVGFIPLFSKLPHAYSTFHVSGVHYFTISCILIPALTIIYTKVMTKKDVKTWVCIGVCNIVAVGIPILCVSRFQLMFAVAFAMVIYLLIYKKITLKMIIILVAIMLPMYIVLTIARNHNIEYLNSIFEMKYAKMPIFITQPYMYIANNYENFNCMVEHLANHTYGLKMLFPVFALTGLKFVFPQLVSFPLFITKQELTTLTMFYDAYYDLGIIGIVLLALVLGFVGQKLSKAVKRCSNPITYLFYGQIAIYLALSFFTTWFSNPTTWFWLALTTMMYLFVGYPRRERK